MMGNRFSLLRFLALAAFIVLVAAALWLLSPEWYLIVATMTVALLIAWTIEWLEWRKAQTRWDLVERDVGPPEPRHVTRLPAAAPVEETLVAASPGAPPRAPEAHVRPDPPATREPAPSESAPAEEPSRAAAEVRQGAVLRGAATANATEADARTSPPSWPSRIRFVLGRPERKPSQPEDVSEEEAELEPPAFGGPVAAADEPPPPRDEAIREAAPEPAPAAPPPPDAQPEPPPEAASEPVLPTRTEPEPEPHADAAPEPPAATPAPGNVEAPDEPPSEPDETALVQAEQVPEQESRTSEPEPEPELKPEPEPEPERAVEPMAAADAGSGPPAAAPDSEAASGGEAPGAAEPAATPPAPPAPRVPPTPPARPSRSPIHAVSTAPRRTPAAPPLRPAPQAPPAARSASPGAPVVTLPRHGVEPREWNVWELDALAREASRRVPERAPEWSYLLLHLREFAAPGGALPSEFDAVVRESFGGLLERIERR